MKKNVLVFPCGSEIGLEIHRSLAYSAHFKAIGGSSVDDHGKYVYADYIGGIQDVHTVNLMAKLNKIIKQNKIDFIIPAHDDVVLKLSYEKMRGNLKCGLITSPYKTCRIARSKSATYECFKNITPVPEVYKKPGDIGKNKFPVFLKPDSGQGTKGVYLAKNRKDVDFYLRKDKSLIILEHLPGKEYTVDCFTDRHGKLVYCEGRERKRILNGISVNTFMVKDARFKAVAARINERLDLRGPWFFQLKGDRKGALKLMEFAPRIAGAMGLSRCYGANLALMGLFDAMGKGVKVIKNGCKIEMDRALVNLYRHDIKYRNVYLDFDDLVVCDGKINPLIISFVFQCVNNKVKVRLLTRHKGDISAALKKARLAGIFDEVIRIKKGEEKYVRIAGKNSIFIDDSFSEREKVHDHCGIPVFDSHMAESLMETF